MSQKKDKIVHKRLSVALPEPLYAEVEQMAIENDMSKDRMAKNLISQAVKERKRKRKSDKPGN